MLIDFFSSFKSFRRTAFTCFFFLSTDDSGELEELLCFYFGFFLFSIEDEGEHEELDRFYTFRFYFLSLDDLLRLGLSSELDDGDLTTFFFFFSGVYDDSELETRFFFFSGVDERFRLDKLDCLVYLFSLDLDLWDFRDY